MLNATPEQREYDKADGTKGTDSYYKVEFKDCEGNQPENEDYDSNKPCADCDGGNPLINMEITSSGASGKQGGTFGCTRIGDICEGIVGKKNHDGLDLSADTNTNVFATHSGKVQSIRDTFDAGENEEDSYGNYVIVKTEINNETHYIKFNHLNEVSVAKDDIINIGEIIGLSGNTGNAADPDVTPHVHMQVFDANWNSLDPMGFIKAQFDANQELTNECNN